MARQSGHLPIPHCVVRAERVGQDEHRTGMAGQVIADANVSEIGDGHFALRARKGLAPS